MYKGKKILATICARGGSKGVPKKNIKKLAGKPLIEYSLKLLDETDLVDDYVVSTDCNEIITVVKSLGYKVDFTRPKHLASDNASRIDAIKHCVDWKLEREGSSFDIVIDLGVATPFKNSEDMDNAIKLCIDSNVDNVFSVCPSIKNPYFNMVEEINGRVKLVKEEKEIKARQKAPEVFEMNDGFNVWKTETLSKDNPQFNKNTKLYIMPRERSVDIDEEEDFRLAEFLLNK